MKTALVKSTGWVLLLLAAFTLQATAQKERSDKDAALQKSLDARHFVFVAQTATPMRGGLQQLTSLFDLRLSNDTVISNLPYFGRAYTAPMNPAQGALTFTATATGYRVKTKKKGAREISITTKAAGDTQRMLLTVFDNGAASLQVSTNNRDPISFSGYVREASADH